MDEILLLPLAVVMLYIMYINYRDIQVIKRYETRLQEDKNESKKQNWRRTHCIECNVYPWWNPGFATGGYFVGPWMWNRSQFYYHPRAGWYMSPFSY